MALRIMMMLIVGTEAIFFLSLMVGFIYFAYYPGFSPLAVRQLNLTTTGIFTALLVASSFTFWRAERSYHAGRSDRLKNWLLATVGLGVVFLAGQGMEYSHLLDDRVAISQGPFATGFFTLTGFHGLHVLVGLIVLAVVLRLAYLGDFDRPDSSVIRSVGIYWHFVDVVWVVVFMLVYVLPHLFPMNGHVTTP